MSSNRSEFSRQAEISRCIRLIDHYANMGWPQRCERVYTHLLRIWRLYADAQGGVTRKWWMAKALARARA